MTSVGLDIVQSVDRVDAESFGNQTKSNDCKPDSLAGMTDLGYQTAEETATKATDELVNCPGAEEVEAPLLEIISEDADTWVADDG